MALIVIIIMIIITSNSLLFFSIDLVSVVELVTNVDIALNIIAYRKAIRDVLYFCSY